jgi:hypothetical protein
MLISNIRFLKWNIPRGFLVLQNLDRVNIPSPLGVQIPLSEDFHIHTPPAVVGSQHEATSPIQLSTALVSIGVIERAGMFLQGRHNELVKSMNNVEARLVTKRVQLCTRATNAFLLVLYQFGYINSGSLASLQQRTGDEDREPGMRPTWAFWTGIPLP